MATILQKVVFKNTPVKKIYDLYMDAKLHSMIIAGPVKISAKPGSKLEAFGGYISGKTLQVVPQKLVVQQWRGSDWNARDTDSVLVLSFEQKGKEAILHVLHANVPDDKSPSLNKGWHALYWGPWKQYLAGMEITRKAF